MSARPGRELHGLDPFFTTPDDGSAGSLGRSWETTPAPPPPVIEDRCAGVLVGLAAGDALGAGYEFTTPGPPPEEAAMTGGGALGWEPGEWTDDTQQAICIAEVLAAAPGQPPDPLAVGQRLLDWYRAGPGDVGNQTRAVLSSCDDPAELSATAQRFFEANPNSSAGNGSLMRTAPVALAFVRDDRPGRDERIAAAARAISALTHADPLAGDACALWCIAIDRAVRQGRFDGVADGIALLPAERRERWRGWIGEALEHPYASFTGNGFVLRALQAALAAIWQTPPPSSAREAGLHLQRALRSAVSIGDDTDTVAAIAGALLGARFGATAVPAAWQVALHGWPGYRTPDLVRLAVLAAVPPHASGWPAVESMLDHYSTTSGRPLARACPHDDGVILSNLTGACELQADPDRRPDVVVSLCRVGRSELEAAQWLQVRLIDTADEATNPNLDVILQDLGGQIAAWRAEGKRVLVHCVAAHSRTPAVAAAYLTQHLGVPGLEALRRVCAVLPATFVDASFRSALERVWPDPDRQRRGR